jgi:hypothetical protein
MPHRDSRLTPDDHVAIGASIKVAMDEIHIVARIAPLASTVQQDAVAAMASLERLRITLDNLLFQHIHDDMDPRQIRDMVYCHEARLYRLCDGSAENKRDVFAHWELEG